MDHLTTWPKKSPLCNNDWKWFAVKLVGPQEAKNIESMHFGGGNHKALEAMLTFWWDNTKSDDRSWKKIIDALEKINKKNLVIGSIEDECLLKPLGSQNI